MRETYHIEVLSEGSQGSGVEVVQRRSVRAGAFASVRERALDLFRRARAPQARGEPAHAVRVTDGAGTEVFLWTASDEATGGR